MSGRFSFRKQNSTKRASNEKRNTTSSKFIAPMRFLKRLREKMARALLFMTKRRRASPGADMSSRRSNPSIAPSDIHRVEAINDCIEFINGSSSFQRCKSVSATD